MVVTIQSLGGRHPRACTVGCYKRDKNKIKIYIYMRTDKCCCNCQKKIHSHLCLRILIHPTWHTTYPKTSFAIEKTRHPSMYRIFLPPGPARDATYSGPKSGKKKRRKGQKTMESQIATKIQLDSQQLYDKNTCTRITRKGGGTVGGAA